MAEAIFKSIYVILARNYDKKNYSLSQRKDVDIVTLRKSNDESEILHMWWRGNRGPESK